MVTEFSVMQVDVQNEAHPTPPALGFYCCQINDFFILNDNCNYMHKCNSVKIQEMSLLIKFNK